MSESKRIEQYIKDEIQRRINEADRPRLRALEKARVEAPGYYSAQPGQKPGYWRMDGTIVK